jgi:hypothetical protein
LRVATFESDVTPPLGAPLIGVVPAAKIEDPLLAKGIVLDDGCRRYVLCAVDWCELMNSSAQLFRRKIATAAGTDIANVAVQCVHQHTAPFVDGDADRLLDGMPDPPLRVSGEFLQETTDRLANAVREAVERLEPFDRIGAGEAPVERVASTRRVHLPGGKLLVRYSEGARVPAQAAAPEGDIDPMIRTITLARGRRPLVRLHYYATHPQTHQVDGIVSKDFAGLAREAVEEKEKVFQIYFTGCAGDVTVGKYNDGTAQAREGLARRLQAGIEASNAATRWSRAGDLIWRTAPLSLPKKIDVTSATALLQRSLKAPEKTRAYAVYLAAIDLAFAERIEPIQLSSLQIGKVHILHLPGEPMVEFQKYARSLKPGDFVAVAGYADTCTGYICTDAAFTEGGYEPSASRGAPGSEALLKEAIRKLMALP